MALLFKDGMEFYDVNDEIHKIYIAQYEYDKLSDEEKMDRTNCYVTTSDEFASHIINKPSKNKKSVSSIINKMNEEEKDTKL